MYIWNTHLVQIHDWQNGDRDQWISFEQLDLDRKLIASVQHFVLGQLGVWELGGRIFMSPFTGKDITKRTTRSLLKLPLSSSYSHSRSSFSHINVRTRSDISKQIAANLCRLPIRIDLGYIYDLNKSSNDIGKCVCMSPRCLACWAKRSTQKRYLLKDEQRLPNSYCTFL